MIDSERNFILWLLREVELSPNSAEFEEAIRCYGISDDEDNYYYLDFLQFIQD